MLCITIAFLHGYDRLGHRIEEWKDLVATGQGKDPIEVRLASRHSEGFRTQLSGHMYQDPETRGVQEPDVAQVDNQFSSAAFDFAVDRRLQRRPGGNVDLPRRFDDRVTLDTFDAQRELPSYRPWGVGLAHRIDGVSRRQYAPYSFTSAI
jgi:hypothetical protein